MSAYLIDLRKEIHQHPELSGQEEETAKRIEREVGKLGCFTIQKIGKTGVLAIHNAPKKGKTLLFRAELDALPIEEVNNFDYRSKIEGVSHKCGHDGHMTILVGLAQWIKDNPPQKGRVGLLFQPAEETGEGAQELLDNWPKSFSPDMSFALHNLPGFETGEVFGKAGLFSLSSKGLIVRLMGKESHASEPENGINPAFAIGQIMEFVKKYKRYQPNSKKLGLITPIHVKLGERAFGTSAGKATLMFTLRSSKAKNLQQLDKQFRSHIRKIARNQKLKASFEQTEFFHEVQNDRKATALVQKCADRSGIKYHKLNKPFKWSEDFGLFTKKFSGALFGLGAGKDTPALHNPNYDFNDKIIPKGITVFSCIVNEVLNE